MARLPTVVLQHPTKGRRIVNEYDYARGLVSWARSGWKLVGTRHGDATKREEYLANVEAKIQHHRTHDPEEVRKRGDAQRAYEAQRIGREVVIEPGPEPIQDDAEPQTEAEASQEAPEVEYDPDWRELPFFKRKQYVLALTGKTPRTASDADRIMAAWLEQHPVL